MRLLRAVDMTFHEFEGSSIPPYAILSHRWEGDEVTYQEMSECATATERRFRFMKNQELKIRTATTERKSGFKKIQQCCEQALEDTIEYVWVDTCCIDKSSSAELSEAINSMYAWYQQSVVCYAYLADVHTWPTYQAEDAHGNWARAGTYGYKERVPLVMGSNWWTRGWTLQELIAPSELIFYSNNSHWGSNNPPGWSKIGDKANLLDLVNRRTGIETYILLGGDVRKCSVAQRMSWASERETTRPEDLAYCLLGIFGVNMPLLYGEGSKAFLRLQEEIMKQSDDQTLFAWHLGFESMRHELCGPFATHPSKFQGVGTLMPIPDADFQSPYSMTNKGLRIELPVIHQGEDPAGIAILHCGTYNTRSGLPVIRLGPPGTNRYARDARSTGPLMAVRVQERTPTVIFMSQEPSIRVEKRRPLRIVISEAILELFPKVYCSAELDQISFPSKATSRAYMFPLSCRRGAILLAARNNSYHLLVLFNIEQQHVGRYACKVIHAENDSDDLTSQQEQIHRVAQRMYETDQSTESVLDEEIEQVSSFSLIVGDSGPPNNRTSFADLPLNRMILAQFAPYDALDSRDDGSLVLQVDILDQSESPKELYELA